MSKKRRYKRIKIRQPKITQIDKIRNHNNSQFIQIKPEPKESDSLFDSYEYGLSDW